MADELDGLEWKVTWEQLVIGDITEGGRRSFSWAARSKQGADLPGFFYEDLLYAAEHGTVPNARTGISNTLVRSVERFTRHVQEWVTSP